MKSVVYHLKKADEAYKKEVRYVGMLRLLKAVFSSYASGNAKTQEESMFEALDTLTDREARVLKLRFGLEDSNFRTLEDVARVFGVTRERIRQIENKSLRKLKHPARKYVLLGVSWQVAVQEAKAMGEKLLIRHQQERTQKRTPISYYEIEEIGLPTRVANALIKGGYETVQDVMKAKDRDLMMVRNVGKKSVRYVREKIEAMMKQND